MRFALAHPEQTSLDDVEGVGFDRGQHTQQPILGGQCC